MKSRLGVFAVRVLAVLLMVPMWVWGQDASLFAGSSMAGAWDRADGLSSDADSSLSLPYMAGLISIFPKEEVSKVVVGSLPRRVGFGPVEYSSDGVFVVPLVIDEMEGVFSGQMEVWFDPALVRVVQVNKGEAIGGYLFASNILEGRILMSFAGTGSGEGGGRLAEVMFESMEPGEDVLSGIRLTRVQLNEGRLEVVSVSEEEGGRMPVRYRLEQNYPNPFNAVTRIRFELPVGGEADLMVYTLNGQRVRTLARGAWDAGTHMVTWDGRDEEGRDVGNGVYMYRLQAGIFSKARTMVVVK